LIWKVLFEMAVKMAPAILFFNECDGVFTKGGSAVRALKQVKWDSKDAPIIIGATNHLFEVDGAIKSRFGPPITFTPFDDDMRKGIVKRMKAPSDFASDDADWESLLPLLQGMEGRDIWQTCKTVAARVERECRNAQIDVRNITLADFQARLQTRAPAFEGMSPTAKEMVDDWIRSTFFHQDDENPDSEKEMVVFLYEDVIAKKDVLPDEILRALGAVDIQKLRAQKARLKTHEPTVLDHLKACFLEALPACRFSDNDTGQARIRLSREEDRGFGGVLTGYIEKRLGDKSNGDKQVRTRGWFVRDLRFRLQLVSDAVKEMAHSLGGIQHEVERILAAHPTWTQAVVDELMKCDAKPTLISAEMDKTPGIRFQAVVCTFERPDSVRVPNIRIPYGLITLTYGSEHEALLDFHGRILAEDRTWTQAVVDELLKWGAKPTLISAEMDNASRPPTLICTFERPDSVRVPNIRVPLKLVKTRYGAAHEALAHL